MITFERKGNNKLSFTYDTLICIEKSKKNQLLELIFAINKLADIHTIIFVYKHTDRG